MQLFWKKNKMQNIFLKRKQDVLSKLDKSHIGKWDEKIAELCDKINSLENYYTTSSCSGRILLMIDQDKKGENLFVFVSHDKISLDKLKEELEKIISNDFARSSRPPARGGKICTREIAVPNIKFKVEPCILHINCKTLGDAEKICNQAKLAGWKTSGIVGMKNGITVELNSTEKLEFPIIQNKKILVDDEFLKITVDEANKKLEKVWEKIEKLEDMIK